MSSRTVLAFLVVAIVLACGAYFALREKPAEKRQGIVPVGARILEIDPATVARVRITSPGGDEQVMERSKDPGAWVVLMGKRNGKQAPWALASGKAESLLRFLAETRAISEPDMKGDAAGGVGNDATTVVTEFDNGGARTIRLAARTLGGKGLVAIDPAVKTGGGGAKEEPLLAVVDDNFHKLIRNPGPRGWRETVALPGIGPDVARIKLSNEERKMALGRVEARWAVTEPIAARAEESSLQTLLKVLSEMQIDSFFDDGEPTDTKLDAPVATISIETDRRILDDGPGASGTVKVRTETHELIIGQNSDGSFQRRYARLGKDGPVVAITVKGLGRELFDPAAYVSRKAMNVVAADVGGIVLEAAETGQTPPAPPPPAAAGGPTPAFPTRVFKRNLDQWVEASGKQEKTLGEEDRKGVAELIGFLTSEPAAAVMLEAPAESKRIGTISLLSLGGSPLDMAGAFMVKGSTFALGPAEGAGKAGVYRVYALARLPLILRAVVAPMAGEQPPAGPGTGAGEPVKPPEVVK